jgi:hypothetical protein
MWQVHRFEFGKRPLPPVFARSKANSQEMFPHLLTDGQHRVEAGQGLLRDEGDVPTEQIATALRRHCYKVLTGEFECPLGDGEAAREELRNSAADHRLSGAGLADEAENHARYQREIEIAQDGKGLVAPE